MKKFLLLLFLFGTFSLNAQLGDQLLVDNEDSTLIRQLTIVACHSYVTKFENNLATPKRLYSLERFNSKGLICSSIDFGKAADTTLYWEIKYDSLDRLKAVHWFEPADSGLEEISMYAYTYNQNGQLNQECEYEKVDGVYVLETCQDYVFQDNDLRLITTKLNDTLSYFTCEGERTYEYNNEHKLVSCYRNGQQEYLIHGNSRFIYTYDELTGNVVFVVNYNTKNDTFNKSIITYENGLPLRLIQYDHLGNLMAIHDYVYSKGE